MVLTKRLWEIEQFLSILSQPSIIGLNNRAQAKDQTMIALKIYINVPNDDLT